MHASLPSMRAEGLVPHLSSASQVQRALAVEEGFNTIDWLFIRTGINESRPLAHLELALTNHKE